MEWHLMIPDAIIASTACGAVIGLVKWSVSRSIGAMDKRLADIEARIDKLFQLFERHAEEDARIRALIVDREDCEGMRDKDRAERDAMRRELHESAYRLEAKVDRLILLLAERGSS